MPGQTIEKNANFALKLIEKMDNPQHRSQQQLVGVGEEPQRTLRDVTYREWVTVAILCFVNLINYMDRYTLAGVLPQIQSYYDIKNDLGGLLQTVFITSYMVFGPLFGYWGDRYNRKIIMGFGVFLWSLTTLVGSLMTNFWWFLVFRALVGIGEASYSTIAPTIISDLFVKNIRSKMLAIFYFAIPVGSGLGYVIGSEMLNLTGKWQWGLRVTPFLGVIAVLMLFFVLKEPVRGQSEGGSHMATTTWLEDLRALRKNKTFMLSTAAFTCIAFVSGALAWWAPKLIETAIKLQPSSSQMEDGAVEYTFGIIAMVAGVTGVPAGSWMSQRLRTRYNRVDAYICAMALMVSSPLIFFALLVSNYSTVVCFILVFFAQWFLNLTWSIVADILLYVVVPTRRSTAEGFQILFSHLFGDAGSPFLIGLVSDMLYQSMLPELAHTTQVPLELQNDHNIASFKSLQYALFITCFVEVLGGVLFLVSSFYIAEDKEEVDRIMREAEENERATHVIASEPKERTYS